jgi:hypothetical protein
VATAEDNSVWVTGEDPSGREFGCLWHLSAGGTVICRQDGSFHGVAIDREGFVWVAKAFTPELHRFHPELVLTTRPDGTPYPDGIPRCAPVDLDPETERTALATPFALEGLAIDDRGILWGGSGQEGAFRLDTLTGQGTTIPDGHPWQPAIGPDRDVWFGRCDLKRVLGYGCELGFVRIDGDGPYVPDESGATPYLFVDTLRIHESDPEGGVENVVVGEDGTVWGSNSGSSRRPAWVVRYRRGQERDVRWRSAPPALDSDLVALGVASDGGIWTAGIDVDDDETISFGRLDPQELTWEIFPVRVGPTMSGGGHWTWTLGDVTGRARHRRATSVGRWVETLDAGWNDAEWVSVDWEEYEPAGAAVDLAVRFGPTPEALAEAPVSCRFADPPAELTGCPGYRDRYMSVEFELTSGSADGLPILRNIRVGRTRR